MGLGTIYLYVGIIIYKDNYYKRRRCTIFKLLLLLLRPLGMSSRLIKLHFRINGLFFHCYLYRF